MSDSKIYKARQCSRARYEHAEGPIWDSGRGELLWVDILGHRMLRARYEPPELTAIAEYNIGQCVGAVAPFARSEDGWVVASEHGFGQLSLKGEYRALAEPELDRPARMNDGKCDPQGRFWAGSMAWDTSPGGGALYRLDDDLTPRVVLPSVTISNGLTWTPDGQTMYYIDTPTRRIDRLRMDPETGQVIDRVAAFLVKEVGGGPDGMTIDDEGCLWVALWGASAVVRYAPDGTELARVQVPAVQVSSCAFGGQDGRTLFITTSQEGLSAAERANDPGAGYLYCVDVDVSGPPATPCRLNLS